MNTILEIENLSVHYKDVEVLRNLSLSCTEGSFISIVGKSGSGKSTLLKAICDFVDYAGKVYKPSNIGLVFQNYAVYPFMTVFENISFAFPGAYSVLERNNKTIGLLEKVGLIDQSKKFPKELSGGQLQRVAIARTMASNPSLILLDEPFSNLDIITSEKMQDWMLEIFQELRIGDNSISVLLITHNIDEAIFLSDRVYVLKDGNVSKFYDVPFGKPRLRDIQYSSDFVEFKRLIINELY